jgi:hypothetical protein
MTRKRWMLRAVLPIVLPTVSYPHQIKAKPVNLMQCRSTGLAF